MPRASRRSHTGSVAGEDVPLVTAVDNTDTMAIDDAHKSSIEPYDAEDRVPSPGAYSRTQSLVDPSELDGKTLYEKKSILVNREIESMGLGKYQWYVWVLCGFGYFLDLLWAQAFGLVLGPLQQELGFGNTEQGNISTSFSAGLTAGAAFWGILVDIIGRKWAFNLTCLFSSVFGLALAGSNNYNTFLVLTAFVGFGIGGNIPIDTTITLEITPQKYRRLLPLLSIFQPCGVVICTAFAYAYIPNYSCVPDWTFGDDALPSCNKSAPPCCGQSNNWGWRYLLLTIGSLTMAVFLLRFVVFNFQESPKFLLYKGNDAAAVKVLQNISKVNKHECKLTLEMLESLIDDSDSLGSSTPMLGSGKAQMKATLKEKLGLELYRYKYLFSTFSMAWLTVLVWLTYACDFWGFTVAGAFVPRILQLKNAAVGEDIKYTYRSYVYIYLPGIVGVLLGVLGYDLPRVGRKWTMFVSSALMAVALFLFATVNSQASNIGLNVMEYFFQSMFNAVLYGWTPEAFPAYIRGTASGMASFFGRLFSIIAPIAASQLLPSGALVWQDYIPLLYLGGGVALGAPVFIFFLPSRKIGQESV